MSTCATTGTVPSPPPESHSLIAGAKHQVQISERFDLQQEELEEDVRDGVLQSTPQAAGVSESTRN